MYALLLCDILGIQGRPCHLLQKSCCWLRILTFLRNLDHPTLGGCCHAMPGIMVEERKSRLHNVCCWSVFMRASIMPGHNAHNHLLSKGTRKSTMNLLSYIIIIISIKIRWGQRWEKAESGVCERAIVILHRRQSPDSPNVGNTLQMTHTERGLTNIRKPEPCKIEFGLGVVGPNQSLLFPFV